jgi:hypothetical protein
MSTTQSSVLSGMFCPTITAVPIIAPCRTNLIVQT